jgi:16S rRNA (cytosine967-C5)-methyltransferase
MTASLARQAALQVVTRVRERSAYAHETLDSVFRETKLDRRDSAFATRLAYGTVAVRGTLDEALLRHLRDPGRLEPAVGDALAVSAYEILFMRTPARAAVSQGVDLAKSVKPGVAGLANAVLRRLAEEAEGFPWGDPVSDDSALARLHGHPLWLAKLWIEELGRETAAQVMAANNEPAPLFLASVSPSAAQGEILTALEDAGAQPQPGELSGSIVAGDPIAALRTDLVRQRSVVVVDAGAQLAAALVPLKQGGTVVEFGAGRGTKSLLMAARAQRDDTQIEVVAADVHGFKLERLAEDASQLGIAGIKTVVADVLSETLPVAEGQVDAVLVDAPCSGFGTLRRHPDRRWRAKPEEIDSVASIGERMLQEAARLVGPGGFVVYSTCTITARENAKVISAFLESDEGLAFSIDPLEEHVPEAWRRFVHDEGWFQSLPEPGGPDGHFIARLVRATDSR